MEAFSKLLGPIIGSTVGAFHLNSNSHRTGDCPCKMQSASSSIWTAAETNDFESLSKRIASNATLIDKLDAYGYTTLHYAAQQNHVRVVRFLLEKGCPPDANGCGATPLHRAAYSGSLESCELLLKAGANPNATDSSYNDMGSCLHKAYSVANVAIVVLLLANGADPLQCNRSGQTPEQLLKKKHRRLFIGVGSITDSSLPAESKTEEISSGVKGCDVVDEDGLNTKVNSLSDPPVVLKDLTVASAVKLEDMGFRCTRCNQHCISFTRLMNGSLICTKCRYKR